MERSKDISGLAYMLCLLMLGAFVRSAAQGQQHSPNEYIPVDGDTLRLLEKDHYRLLKYIDGFQYAVFSRNEDDSFDARVMIMIGDARKELVVQKCRSLAD